ncbi:hypothetical protein ACFL09_06125, partial [Planctomycetota bacterium]
MTRSAIVAALVAFVVATAAADTLTHNTTGQKLDGKLLGTVTQDSKSLYLFKSSDGKLHKL